MELNTIQSIAATIIGFIITIIMSRIIYYSMKDNNTKQIGEVTAEMMSIRDPLYQSRPLYQIFQKYNPFHRNYASQSQNKSKIVILALYIPFLILGVCFFCFGLASFLGK